MRLRQRALAEAARSEQRERRVRKPEPVVVRADTVTGLTSQSNGEVSGGPGTLVPRPPEQALSNLFEEVCFSYLVEPG